MKGCNRWWSLATVALLLGLKERIKTRMCLRREGRKGLQEDVKKKKRRNQFSAQKGGKGVVNRQPKKEGTNNGEDLFFCASSYNLQQMCKVVHLGP